MANNRSGDAILYQRKGESKGFFPMGLSPIWGGQMYVDRIIPQSHDSRRGYNRLSTMGFVGEERLFETFFNNGRQNTPEEIIGDFDSGKIVVRKKDSQEEVMFTPMVGRNVVATIRDLIRRADENSLPLHVFAGSHPGSIQEGVLYFSIEKPSSETYLGGERISLEVVDFFS